MKYTLLIGFGVVSAVMAYLYYMQQKQEQKLQFLMERFNQLERHYSHSDEDGSSIEHFGQTAVSNVDNEAEIAADYPSGSSGTFPFPDKPRALSNDSNGPKTPTVSESSRENDEQSIDDIEREIIQLKEELGEFYEGSLDVLSEEPLLSQTIFLSIDRNQNPLYNIPTNAISPSNSCTKIEVYSNDETDNDLNQEKTVDVSIVSDIGHTTSTEMRCVDSNSKQEKKSVGQGVKSIKSDHEIEFLTDNSDTNILNYIHQHMETNAHNDNKSNKIILKNNMSQFEDLDDIDHIENNELDSYINQAIENRDIEFEQHLETLSQTSLTDITKIENNNLEVKIDVIANTWKLSDLKDICKGNGLSQKGNKHELIKRILEHIPDVFENPKNDFENKSKTNLLN